MSAFAVHVVLAQPAPQATLIPTSQWLSLTPAGRLTAVFDVPTNVRVLDCGLDHVLVAERDADDLELVAVYTLLPRQQ